MQITAPLAVQQAAVSKALFDAIGGPDEANGVLTPSQIGVFGTVWAVIRRSSMANWKRRLAGPRSI